MKVAIVGVGLIGGSAAIDLRARQFATTVVGVDANRANGEDAIRLGLVDRMAELGPACREADLVVLAVPVGAIESLLPRVLEAAGEGTTVTDMGSTKERICRAVEGHARRAQYVASHPMAGTEHSG